MTTMQSGIDQETSPIPVAGSPVASLPREERRSAREVGRYIWEQYQSAGGVRKPHAISWIMVQSYLRGIHYFIIDAAGGYSPIPRTPGQIRESVPLLHPMYRHVLGFLNSNELGVSTVPVAGSSQSLYKADRAQASLNHWLLEIEFASFYDRANQMMLTEGMVGYHRYIDHFRQNVMMRPIPQSNLYPIPFDANDPSQLNGITEARVVTKSWLELQDELFERQEGRPPPVRLADAAKGMNANASINSPFNHLGFGTSSKFDGALVLTTWMKSNEKTPGGEYIFMVGDKVFRHAIGRDIKDPATSGILDRGNLPIEFVYYDKNPADFYGIGLCEALLPGQISIDRQMTMMSRNAKWNRPLTFVRSNQLRVEDMQDDTSPLIHLKDDSLGVSNQPPVLHFPTRPAGRDTTSLIDLSVRFTDSAAGFRSGIAFGQSEGRVESGPATSILAQNAMASLNSPLKRTKVALLRTYEGALNWFSVVWKPDKVIRIVGPSNVGREITLGKDSIPSSDQVIILPTPLIAGGRQALVSILFQLRQMPGEDGVQGTEVSSQEFRQSLAELGFMPPGLKRQDKTASRIQTRINLLINDGKTPGTQPIDPTGPGDPRSLLEDHKTFVDMLKPVILDDSYLQYGPEVQKALLNEMKFHQDRTIGGITPPDGFDDDIDKQEAIEMENFFAGEEARLDSPLDFPGNLF